MQAKTIKDKQGQKKQRQAKTKRTSSSPSLNLFKLIRDHNHTLHQYRLWWRDKILLQALKLLLGLRSSFGDTDSMAMKKIYFQNWDQWTQGKICTLEPKFLNKSKECCLQKYIDYEVVKSSTLLDSQAIAIEVVLLTVWNWMMVTIKAAKR